MRLSTSKFAITASAFVLWAELCVAGYNATTYLNCFSLIPSTFVDNGTYEYQSTGYCQEQCVGMGYPVMALYQGNDCLCGSEVPSNSSESSSCTTACYGYGQETCGGKDAYSFYLTGVDKSYTTDSGSSGSSSTSTTSSSSSTTSGVTVVTKAGQTIYITPTNGASSGAAKSGSSSTTVGIAAGVVVGVVSLCSIFGAAVFFIRRRNKQRVEEEYRRNAEINAFTQKKPSSLNSDPRWDADYMAQRRQSNGSIADDEDFSRRILQVTNPDR